MWRTLGGSEDKKGGGQLTEDLEAKLRVQTLFYRQGKATGGF